jgi:hypothetical protein
MNWTVELIEDKNYFKITLEGGFNVKDHLRMIEDVISRQIWKSGMNVLLDSRNVDYKNAGVEVMKKAGENMSKFDEQIGEGKAALLMNSIPNFGKGRQFELLTEQKVSANVAVFLEENQALEWLCD